MKSASIYRYVNHMASAGEKEEIRKRMLDDSSFLFEIIEEMYEKSRQELGLEEALVCVDTSIMCLAAPLQVLTPSSSLSHKMDGVFIKKKITDLILEEILH